MRRSAAGACMRKAIAAVDLPEPAASWLGEELGRVAVMLVNCAGEP